MQWLNESLDVFRGDLLQSGMEKSFSILGAETEIRAPSSPVLHKRLHSGHVVIIAARLERAAMTSAALCNPLPSKCVITDGVIGTQGTHSVRVCVCIKSR